MNLVKFDAICANVDFPLCRKLPNYPIVFYRPLGIFLHRFFYVFTYWITKLYYIEDLYYVHNIFTIFVQNFTDQLMPLMMVSA